MPCIDTKYIKSTQNNHIYFPHYNDTAVSELVSFQEIFSVFLHSFNLKLFNTKYANYLLVTFSSTTLNDKLCFFLIEHCLLDSLVTFLVLVFKH